MKDANKRRRKAERELTKRLPGIEPSLTVVPIREERLVNTCGGITSVAVQGNEFIATSNMFWGLSLYNLGEVDTEQVVDDDSISDITFMSEEAAVANERRPIWRTVPVSDTCTELTFIAKDIVVCTETNRVSSGRISTWDVRSGRRLDGATLGRLSFAFSTCKITDNEFVVGCNEGHLCFFTHNNGYEVKETKRIWMAHKGKVGFIACDDDIIVSTSTDCRARLWDAKNKEPIAVLYHNGEVTAAGISKQYIMTCSEAAKRKGNELRIFMKEDGYPLYKMFRSCNIWYPRFIRHDLVLYWTYDYRARQHYLVFYEFESEIVIAQLNIGHRHLFDYDILEDGRLVTGGDRGFRGVISTLPEYLSSLILPDTGGKGINDKKKRRMCVIM